MKNLLILILILGYYSIAPAQKKSPSGNIYTLKLSLDKTVPGKAYLSIYNGLELSAVDSVEAGKGNEYVFKLSSISPHGFYNMRISQKQQLDVLFNNENIELATKADWFTDSLKLISSNENKVYNIYLKQQQSISTEMLYWNELNKRYAAQPEKKFFADNIVRMVDSLYRQHEREMLKLAADNSSLWMNKFLNASFFTGELRILQNKKDPTDADKNYFRQHYFDNIDFSDETFIHTRILADKYYYYFNYLVPNKPEEFVTAADLIMAKAKSNDKVFAYSLGWLTNAFTIAKKEDIVSYLTDSYKTNKAGCPVNSTAGGDNSEKLSRAKATAVGGLSPVLEVPDSAGKMISLRNIDAPYTVLLFWAASCDYCKMFLPKLNEELQPYYKKGLQVYAVSLDSDKKTWLDFVKRNKLDGIHVSELKGNNANAAAIFNVKNAPTIFLLDKFKTIIAKNIEVEDLADYLKEYLKGKEKDN